MKMNWAAVVFGLLCAAIAAASLIHANQVRQTSERYRKALSDIESPSPGPRKNVIRTILTPVDDPLPDVPRQTRAVLGLLLGDENAEVRQRAAMSLSSEGSLMRTSDPSAYRRIMVALSRAMADDPDPDCRRIAALCLDFDVTQRRTMDKDSRKLCEPYWRRATHDADSDVKQYARDFLAVRQ